MGANICLSSTLFYTFHIEIRTTKRYFTSEILLSITLKLVISEQLS